MGAVIGIGLARLISWVGIPMPPPPGMASGYIAGILVTPGWSWMRLRFPS